jgi:Carboxypeptidase regulatory-like domain
MEHNGLKTGLKMKTLCNWAILLMAFSLIPISALAQNAISTGSISGQITDASGAGMEGATVTAASDATGVKLTAKTNGTGFYSFPSLSVGPYDITVSQAGFKTAIAHGVVVQVGQNVAANVAMQVGEIAQSVTVTAEVPLLRTTESTVSTVVNENLIANLPLSGRR